MIRLLKVIKKYSLHFNEHPTLYNNIINECFELYGKVDNNTNLNVVKNKTINKSIKEMVEKNGIITEEHRKVIKKYCFKGSAEEEKCFIRYICETGGIIIIKKCSICFSKECYTKEHVLNKCLYLKNGEIEQKKVWMQ